jgi:hypothetical protein
MGEATDLQCGGLNPIDIPLRQLHLECPTQKPHVFDMADNFYDSDIGVH